MQPTGTHLEKDTDFWEVVFVALMIGIVGAIFMVGTFAWQEIEMQKHLDAAYYQIQNNK